MSQKVRVRYAKLGKIRWTSHRDTARMWERAFRRVALPLAYSEGFSPRPRVSFGLALPTGYESVAEYLDLELAEHLSSEEVAGLPGRLSAALPSGVDATAAAVLEPATPSLQEAVSSCSWRFLAARREWDAPAPSAGDLEARVGAFLGATSAPVTRMRKGVATLCDVRPAVLDLRVEGEGEGGVWLQAELACRPQSIRPQELLAALGGDLEERQVRRLNQWIAWDGARTEPLAAQGPGATSAPHALERAS